MTHSLSERLRRQAFIAGAVAAGAGVLLGDHTAALAAGRGASAGRDTIQGILNTVLVAEQVAMTFYYTGLTSPAVMHDRRLGGRSADPNRPGQWPGGNPANVKDLQAILDSEVKHAAALLQAGATSPYTQFYFPAATFSSLGSPGAPGTFLGVLDLLETTFVGAYLAAMGQFLDLSRPDLAGVIVQIMGVEAEHRMLGRLIAGITPANNLTLQKMPFSSMSEARAALHPFLTGRGFQGAATGPVALPAAPRTTPVIGTYSTRIVNGFLQGGY